jgi:hypothetical protein
MKAIFCALVLCAVAACSNDSNTNQLPCDGGPGCLTDAGCYLNPATNVEIINACTDAGYLDKSPTLPLLLPDGGLPPLP